MTLVDFHALGTLYYSPIYKVISKIFRMKKAKKNNKKSTNSSKKTVKQEVNKETKKVAGNSSRIMPLGDRVLVRPFVAVQGETTNSFGLIIPETTSKERPEQGEVIAVGEGRRENSKLVPLKVKVGDKVVFSKYGFDEVKIDEKEFYIIKEENILAILK